MPDVRAINRLLDRLAAQPFRAKFRLSGRDRQFVEQQGMDTVRAHARDLLAKRLWVAYPVKDGKQTPYAGHPVFVAQHATATCCRTCLHRWHGIEKGRELTSAEATYVVEVIARWVTRQVHIRTK